MDLEPLKLGEFLDALGAKTPAPGGGAAASLVGSIGAALGQMVVSYSTGRKSLQAHVPQLESAKSSLDRARAVLIELAAEDAAGYAALNELQKLPPTDPNRTRDEPAAAAAAINAPRATAAACADLLRLLESLVTITNPNLASDLAISAVLSLAAARSAWWNVEVNLNLVPVGDRAALKKEGEVLLSEAATRCERIEAACRRPLD
jgi:methenyltetrahydrofolate cyclohydrolase